MDSNNNKKKRKNENDASEVHHPHKKRRIEFDLSTNFSLPKEIMLDLFEQLSPTDFKASAVVCKYWYECSAKFCGWTFIGDAQYELNLKESERQFYESILAEIPCSKLFEGHYIETDYLKPFSVSWTGSALQVIDEKNTVATSINVPRSSRKNVIEDYLADNASDCPEWRIEAHAWKQHNLDNAHEKHFIVFKLYINAKELQEAVNNDTLSSFPKFKLVLKYGVRDGVGDLLDEEFPKIMESERSRIPYLPPKIKPPKGLKEGFKWHRYQLECVSWMKSIEDNVDKEFKYCDLVPWLKSRVNLLFDLHNSKHVMPKDADEYIGTFKSRGGVLADAVGLGKTLEMIGLVLATQDKKLAEFDENGLFNTKASLVICSSHIALQWASEIAKFTELRVTLITSVKEATEVSYGDIIDSDVVIVATSLLKNKSYLSIGCAQNIVSLAPKLLTVRSDHLTNSLKEVKKKKNRRNVSGAPLDHFHFKRVIVDEAHEVLLDQFILAFATKQISDYFWYVSATPFPSNWLLEAVKKFLGIWPLDFKLKSTLADLYEHYVELDVIMKNLVWRNTKESIQDEYGVPDYDEQVMWIDCHPIEAKFYQRVNLKHTPPSKYYMITSLDSYKDDQMYPLLRSYNSSCTWTEKELRAWNCLPYVLKNKTITSKKEEKQLKVLNEYGSKYAKILFWLQERIAEDDSNRFLFFSKNNTTFGRFGQMLEEHGIVFSKFDGNVNQKAKGLKKFKEENIKVMLLSLVKSASGLNLIEANYVVLMDPMTGSAEESRAYELQALGRSHRQGQDQTVHLIRFIMRDTFEEELYKRNKSNGRGT